MNLTIERTMASIQDYMDDLKEEQGMLEFTASLPTASQEITTQYLVVNDSLKKSRSLLRTVQSMQGNGAPSIAALSLACARWMGTENGAGRDTLWRRILALIERIDEETETLSQMSLESGQAELELKKAEAEKTRAASMLLIAQADAEKKIAEAKAEAERTRANAEAEALRQQARQAARSLISRLLFNDFKD
jgi:hypothetical protein